MRDMLPIKVKIGSRPNGHADHPDWTRLQIVKSSGLGTMYKPDLMGGWKYDKTCGHADDTPESPAGVQYGMLTVSPEFAYEAISVFPDKVSIMTEAEAEDFWDNKAMAYISENKTDSNELVSLKSEYDIRKILGQNTADLEAKMSKAIDPRDDAPGLKKRKNKKWSDAKANYGVSVQKRA